METKPTKGDGDMAQEVEHMFSMCEVLSLILNTTWSLNMQEVAPDNFEFQCHYTGCTYRTDLHG